MKVNNSFSGSDGTDITLTNPATFISIYNHDASDTMSITINGHVISLPPSTAFSEHFERFTAITVTNTNSCTYTGYTTGPTI